MIPSTWHPVHREDDGELIGYVEPTADGHQARTLFGYPLGAPTSDDEAETTLRTLGLGYLANRWLLTLADRADPVAVEIVEVTPDRLTAKNVDIGYEADFGARFTLPVPAAAAALTPERRLLPD
jgi:hypothetical protein